MSKLPRGRPSTNDAAKLQSLANLLRKDPDLKVTTDIRALSIIDPSDIRRIRDKYNGVRRVVPGKSAPHLDQVYLTKLFDRLKSSLYTTAQIHFHESGIAMFAGRDARTLHIPGRASVSWVKTTFVPKATQFLRRARDHKIVGVADTDVTVDQISEAFGVSPKRVHQIRKRTNSAA